MTTLPRRGTPSTAGRFSARWRFCCRQPARSRETFRCCCRRRRTRPIAAGQGDHARAGISLARLLRQAAVRPDGPLRAGARDGFRASLAAPGRCDPGRDGGPGGRRPVDRAGHVPRLELAAGLHAPVGARLGERGHLERPRRRPLRLPRAGHPDRPASARCRIRSIASAPTAAGPWRPISAG